MFASTMRNILRKIILGPKASSEAFVKHLRNIGVRIGDRTHFFSPNSVLIDQTRPWLIEIGNDVQITHGVIMLTHGFDWSVLKGVYGEILGSSGKITIGNNVFIGMNSIILKGASIGNNVIIGAGSLVNHDIPDNCVAAGNPAKVIMSLDEYYVKRKAVQLNEAKQLVHEYRSVYNREPDEYTLNEFFWLFSNDDSEFPDCWKKQMQLLGNESFSKEVLSKHKKAYANMQAFLNDCD